MRLRAGLVMNVLLIGEIASRNLGDQAIFATLRNLLQSQGLRVTGLDLSRYVRVSPTDVMPGDNRFVVNESRGSAVKSRMLKVVNVLPNAAQKWVVFLTKKRAAIMRRGEWEKEIKQYDLVIFGGGALLMDNNWSFPLALSNFSRAVRAAGVRYVCVGCSTGRRFSRNGGRWLREFLDGCEYISLRDAESLDGLRLLGDYDADVHVDSALMTADLVARPGAPNPRLLGLNVMSPVRHPRLTREVYGAYLGEMARFIQRAGNGEAGAWERIILFTTGDMRDQDAARVLANSPEARSSGIAVELAPMPKTLGDLCAIVAECGAVVSSRMHAGILAKSFGRPLVALGWDEKVAGFCDTIGIRDSFVNIEEFRAEQLLAKVLQLAESGLRQPDEVPARISELQRLAERLEALALENVDG